MNSLSSETPHPSTSTIDLASRGLFIDVSRIFLLKSDVVYRELATKSIFLFVPRSS